MKRLTLLTILLVVVGLTAGFALEVKPSFSLSGSGTVQWGVDLESGWTGFKNSYAADLTVTLMAADGSDTHAGKEGWYGSITLSNVELYATDGVWALVGDATVAAQIVGMGGNLKIGVYGAPTVGKDYVAGIEEGTYDDTVVDATETGDVGVYYSQKYGTYLSYTVSEALMLGCDVISYEDWTANDTNAYAFEFEAQAKAAGFTVNAGVSYGFGADWAGTPVEFGVNVAGTVGPVALWVGFDGISPTFAFDVGATATLTLPTTNTLAVGVYYGDAFNGLDLQVAFTEPAAKGLVDNLDAGLTFYLLDVGGTIGMEYEVIFTAGYLMGKAYPHFGLTYGDAANPTDDAAFLSAYAHLDYTLFDAAKTVLSIEWNGVQFIPAVDLGILTIGVTITY